ncbi:MAG: hypothetical protein V4592_21710 [Bacteroidota bacterium]
MAATTAIQRANRQVKPFTRCKRNSAQSVKERTAGHRRNGFLTHQFKPFWAFEGSKGRVEREFLHSLSQLCEYYGLPISPPKNVVFPQSIYQTWCLVCEALKAKGSQLDCFIACDDDHVATLATVSRYDTGMNLFYIPVRPLWHWAQSAEAQKLANLLLGICAYLHQVVQIPFYTENSSYLGGQYQMIEDWVNDDQDDADDRQSQLDELYTMHNAGLKLHEQIRNPHYLEQFSHIVSDFQPVDDWEKGWEAIAVEFLALYQKYPQRSIFDNIHSGLLYPEDEDRISADQYISFYWSGEGYLAETLFDTVNCNFQEIPYMDEPMHLQIFDRLPEHDKPDFDFEDRLFEQVWRFCKLLNDHDDEEREPNI